MKLNKKERLIKTAVELAHSKGLSQSSIADLAAAAEVPVGNVYYYFNKKEDIAHAVINERMHDYDELRASWDKKKGPRSRITAFIDMTLNNASLLAKYGCPIGGLCLDLRKQNSSAAEKSSLIFNGILTWLEKQFTLLGAKEKSARLLATHVLSSLQGASVLCQSFNDVEYIKNEAKTLKKWLLEVEKKYRIEKEPLSV